MYIYTSKKYAFFFSFLFHFQIWDIFSQKKRPKFSQQKLTPDWSSSRPRGPCLLCFVTILKIERETVEVIRWQNLTGWTVRNACKAHAVIIGNSIYFLDRLSSGLSFTYYVYGVCITRHWQQSEGKYIIYWKGRNQGVNIRTPVRSQYHKQTPVISTSV